MSSSSTDLLKHIRIVLIHTRHPGNIGGTARAMKNMGIEQLYLVEPKQFPDGKANARAASATDILDSAVVCDTLSQALKDCQFVVGTSARERTIPWPLNDARTTAEMAMQRLQASNVGDNDSSTIAPIAIVFGREDRGLTNEELEMCHAHMTIPTNENYSSLNLAAAVQVMCYELRMAVEKELSDVQKWDVPPASFEQLELYYEHLQSVLERVNFIDAKAPRKVMTRFKRLYNRIDLDEMEIAMLRGMLSQVEKQLNVSLQHQSNEADTKAMPEQKG